MYFLSCFRHIYIITLILTLGIKPKRLPSGSFQKTFAGAPLTTPFMLATRVVPVEGMFQNQRPGHCKTVYRGQVLGSHSGWRGCVQKPGCDPSWCCCM